MSCWQITYRYIARQIRDLKELTIIAWNQHTDCSKFFLISIITVRSCFFLFFDLQLMTFHFLMNGYFSKQGSQRPTTSFYSVTVERRPFEISLFLSPQSFSSLPRQLSRFNLAAFCLLTSRARLLCFAAIELCRSQFGKRGASKKPATAFFALTFFCLQLRLPALRSSSFLLTICYSFPIFAPGRHLLLNM